MKKRIVLVLIIALQLISLAYGIGLKSSSLREEIYFKPGIEQTYYYSIVPFKSEVHDVEVYIVDETTDGTTTNVSQYFMASQTLFKGLQHGKETPFSVTLKLPSDIPEPGTHRVHIGVREIVAEGGIAVRTAIESLISIQAPYEGVYLKRSITANNVNEEQPIAATVHISNLGTEAINNIYADVFLKNGQNSTIRSTRTSIIALGPRENKELPVTITTNGISSGNYVVAGDIYYDGNNAYVETPVKIGYLSFSIVNHTKEIITNKINEMEVEVESLWADPVSDVYAEIEIEGVKVLKTYSESFAGFERKTLKGFYDTKLAPGTYNANIYVIYEGKRTDKATTLTVLKDPSLRFASNFSLTNILLVTIVVIILIINIVLFSILLKKKEEHENQK